MRNPRNTDFSHLDENNNPGMVDVSQKQPSQRKAVASSMMVLPPEVMKFFKDGEISTKKGPVLQTARIAGIMAAKKTGDLIPLCHPLGLEDCKIEFNILDNQQIEILCTASIFAKTGVEMEALTGASIAALTIYDMCKALSHDIRITETKLIAKKGGKNDFSRR